MNIQKFTQKSLEAMQNLEKISYDYGHQEVTQEHLVYALLEGIAKILLRMIFDMRFILARKLTQVSFPT